MSFKGEREVNLSDRSADFYLNNPPRQPKREIADYVESKGILVPRRFANLDQALSSGKPFIIRSEHLQEYDGVSNLLKSLKITREQIGMNRGRYGSELREMEWDYVFRHHPDQRMLRLEAEGKIIAQLGNISQDRFEDNLKNLSRRNIDEYCRLQNINSRKFFSEISYSYWELLKGYNRTIVVDSGISGRYHIFTTTTTPNGERQFGYTIVEDGKIIPDISYLLLEEDLTLLSSVSFYESVRNLGHFDKNQCPLVEMQTVNGNHYFLQYHRGTDINPSQFKLEREAEKNEIKATFVRGVTPKEGMIVKVNFHSGNENNSLRQEDGAIDDPALNIFTELMVKQRKLQISIAASMKDIAVSAADEHLPKSILFKPLISVILKDREVASLFEETFLDDPNSALQIQVRVVSDGRRAYIKRLR